MFFFLQKMCLFLCLFARTKDTKKNISKPKQKYDRKDEPERQRSVQFEEALADAVASGSGSVTATVGESLEPTRLDGNNVNLDTETLSSVDTMLRYQFATQAINGSFSSMRTAMRTS